MPPDDDLPPEPDDARPDAATDRRAQAAAPPEPLPDQEPGGGPPVLYGGQAVLEGVMMRGQRSWSVAVRRPSDEIYVQTRALRPLAARVRLFRLPFFRGVGVLADSMAIGVRALAISGNQSLGEDEQLSERQMNWSLAIGAIFFSFVFILLPATGTNWLSARLPNHFAFNLVEGLARIAFFLLYIVAISQLKDIRRVFQYHGAEHMAIHCYEARQPLSVDNVRRFPTLHVRCGTNFLLILFVTMLVLFTVAFGVLGRPPLLVRVLLHLAAVPVIVGIAYEAIRLGAGRERSALVQALMRPGLWLQMLTTKPPSEDQIEVAIRALEHVLPAEERSRVTAMPSPVVIGEPEPSEPGPDVPLSRPSGAG
ncbi:MAG TPA: DUF1385 domain-containing protein [Actinomycetes bacterium]|nr:DUF1385 domain-containing protein [Actinomycetes bacterium]